MTQPQNHIATLNDKIDSLHNVIDQLSERLSLFMVEKEGAQSHGGRHPEHGASRHYNGRLRNAFEQEIISHKDVLSEEDYLIESERVAGDQVLSSEVQVQRLTAQLTAAYNRIAALEEQLLARRVH
ncbi:MAG: hypothetical protein WBA57_06650 [Elainellaceae cyanobacterium]